MCCMDVKVGITGDGSNDVIKCENVLLSHGVNTFTKQKDK